MACVRGETGWSPDELPSHRLDRPRWTAVCHETKPCPPVPVISPPFPCSSAPPYPPPPLPPPHSRTRPATASTAAPFPPTPFSPRAFPARCPRPPPHLLFVLLLLLVSSAPLLLLEHTVVQHTHALPHAGKHTHLPLCKRPSLLPLHSSDTQAQTPCVLFFVLLRPRAASVRARRRHRSASAKSLPPVDRPQQQLLHIHILPAAATHTPRRLPSRLCVHLPTRSRPPPLLSYSDKSHTHFSSHFLFHSQEKQKSPTPPAVFFPRRFSLQSSEGNSKIHTADVSTAP